MGGTFNLAQFENNKFISEGCHYTSIDINTTEPKIYLSLFPDSSPSSNFLNHVYLNFHFSCPVSGEYNYKVCQFLWKLKSKLNHNQIESCLK